MFQSRFNSPDLKIYLPVMCFAIVRKSAPYLTQTSKVVCQNTTGKFGPNSDIVMITHGMLGPNCPFFAIDTKRIAVRTLQIKGIFNQILKSTSEFWKQNSFKKTFSLLPCYRRFQGRISRYTVYHIPLHKFNNVFSYSTS